MFRYNQYCPIAKSAEVLGDRWTLLIVRELVLGVGRFNQIYRGLPGISRSVLTERLRRLEDLGVIHRQETDDARVREYRLTEVGDGLREVVSALGSWGARWFISDPTPQEADPDLIMMWNAKHVDESALPARRVVVEFQVRAPRRRSRYWLVLARGDVSLCRKYPGFESDVTVQADASTLYRVYLGRLDWNQAGRNGLVQIEGSRSLVRDLPKWLPGSGFSGIVREKSSGARPSVTIPAR